MRKLNLTSLVAAVICGLVIAACGRGADENEDVTADPSFVDGSPDFAGVAMELAGDDGSGADGTLSSPLVAEYEAPLGEDAPEFLPVVRKTVRGINQTVAAFVRRIEAAVRANPNVATGTTHTWEATGDGIDYRFTMTKVAEKRFTFTLDARKDGDDAAEYTKILDGENFVGNVAHRGAGYLRCDLTALHGLDAAKFPPTGEIRVKFAHTAGLKRLVVKLTNYVRSAGEDPATAAYVYTSTGNAGAGGIKLAIHANLNPASETDKTAQEWLLIRGRWLRNFAARFDAVAFGGDVPAGAWVRGRECLAAGEDGVTAFKRVVYHPATGAPVELRQAGNVQACAPGLRNDPPASELPETQADAEAAAMSEEEIDAPTEE